MSIRPYFTKATDTTLLQIDSAIIHARPYCQNRDFSKAESILWAAFDESNLFDPKLALSSFLGEASIGEDVTEHTVELLTQLAEVYETNKQYLEAAACFHKSIPPHDRLDTYAWQRCFTLQDKVQEQTKISYTKQEWETLLDQTWASLLARAVVIKQNPPAPHQEEVRTAPDIAKKPIGADAPVYAAA